MAKVICMSSAKGGSGKTVIATSLAHFLGALGQKTLLIDCDSATHGLTLLHIVEVAEFKKSSKEGLFDLNSKFNSLKYLELKAEDCTIQIARAVDLMPSTSHFNRKNGAIVALDSQFFKQVIAQLSKQYDYILLDVQAGSDSTSRLAMSDEISDQVVIVTELDPMSAAGVERLKLEVGHLDYTRARILQNKVLPEFIDSFTEMSLFSNDLPPIPWNADVVRAYARRKIPLDLVVGNAFTLSIISVAKDLFENELISSIEEWSRRQTYKLKEPIERQYQILEARLSETINMYRKHNIFRAIVFAAITGSFLGIISILGIRYSMTFDFYEIMERIVENKFLLPACIGLVVIGGSLINDFVKLSWGKSRSTYRYERKIEILEERLKELEVLRTADYPAIVNSVNNIKMLRDS